MEEVFQAFLKDKIYGSNFSPRTVKCYQEVYARWQKMIGENPTADNIKEFVAKMRESGLSVTTCNISIRTMNSFLSWLFENKYTSEHLRLKQIRQEKEAKQGFTTNELAVLLAWKPKNKTEKRLYAFICALADTGCRVNELLELKAQDINWQDRLITVIGKKKQRILPISDELRKRLWPYRDQEYIFSTRTAKKVTYFNMRRELKNLCKKLKITWRGFHSMRRLYAVNFFREGGNLLTLKRLMGHSDLKTTEVYIRLETSDLVTAHRKTSLLSRLK